MTTSSDSLIETTTSLEGFFKQRIEQAVDKLNIEGNDDTLWYLTQLLCTYSKTSRFLDNNGTRAALTPLAEYYRLAVESPTKQQKRLQLQRLGDVAIVVAGLFAGALDRKTINVCYYMSMGKAAYGNLADEAPHSARQRARQHIFESLSNNFNDYVIALSRIPACTSTEKSLIQLLDDWESSHHPALANELRSQGVFIDEHLDHKTMLLH